MQQLNDYFATIFVVGGIVSAIIIAADLRSCPQGMRIMNSVWILTGLWASVFGLWGYFAFGRERRCRIDPQKSQQPTTMPGMTMETAGASKMDDMPGMQMDGMPGMPMADSPSMQMSEPMEIRPRWQSVTLSTLHCGAGCTLADLVGEWFLFFVPVAIGGSVVAGGWGLDYVLALVIGIGFQYAAIRGMNRTLPRPEAIRRAARADILSLTAWQVGMFGWMAVVIFVFNDGEIPSRTSFYFWFMMQIAMAWGFLAALPVNLYLIRKGIKHGM